MTIEDACATPGEASQRPRILRYSRRSSRIGENHRHYLRCARRYWRRHQTHAAPAPRQQLDVGMDRTLESRQRNLNDDVASNWSHPLRTVTSMRLPMIRARRDLRARTPPGGDVADRREPHGSVGGDLPRYGGERRHEVRARQAL